MLKKLIVAGAATLLWLFASPVSAAPQPLAAYGQLPGFERAAISPSGQHIAVIATQSGVRSLLVLDKANHQTTAANVSQLKVRSIEWAGDTAVLVRYSETVSLGMEFTTSKAELGSVVVVPIDGRKAWGIFAGKPHITGGVTGSYGMVERNGTWFGYFGGYSLILTDSGSAYLPPGRISPDLFEVNLQTGDTHLIERRSSNGDIERSWLVDGSGAAGATLDILHKTGQWSIVNQHGNRLASGTDPLGRVGLVGFTPDGASVIYATRDPKDSSDTWFSVPLTGGSPQTYLPDVTIKEYFTDSGHRLTGYIVDSASGEGHFFDSRRDKIYRASRRAFPGLRMNLVDSSAAFEDLLVTTEGPGDPITWWKINIGTGRADEIGYAYPIPSAEVGPMRMVAFTAADGLKMEGVLTLPPDRAAKGLPLVMLPHGGPAAHDIAGFDWIAQAFASRGYAVFQPNFRGSSGYGYDFEVAGHGEWGRKMQTDISDGLAELVRQGIVDPHRACIVGASYGGYAALAGVTLQQGIYRCAVAIAGISDLARMVRNDVSDSGHDRMIFRNLEQEVGTGKNLDAVSPIRFAAQVAVPVMLIHGKDDTVVQYAQSSSMAGALRSAGKPVEFVTLPGEDHWLSKSETRLAMLNAAVGFVMANNPADPAR